MWKHKMLISYSTALFGTECQKMFFFGKNSAVMCTFINKQINKVTEFAGLS